MRLCVEFVIFKYLVITSNMHAFTFDVSSDKPFPFHRQKVRLENR